MWLHGCSAGAEFFDYYAQYNIKTVVYAYDVGTYFSPLDADNETYEERTGIMPPGLPMYLVPVGTAGDKPKMLPFSP